MARSGDNVELLRSLVGSPLPANVLHDASAQEPLILLTRAAQRTEAIFGLEMQSTSLRAGLSGDLAPFEFERGMWCIPRDSHDSGNMARTSFLRLLPMLASIRRVLRPLVCGATAEDLVAQLEECSLEAASWSLTIESLTQRQDRDTLPWIVDDAVPDLTIAVARGLRRGMETYRANAGKEGPHAHLVLVCGKRSLVLCIERKGILNATESVHTWAVEWRTRSDSFNARTDPEVAIAITNTALNAVALRQRRKGGSTKGSTFVHVDGGAQVHEQLHLLDPCTGGGTIAAAAKRLGVHVVWASDASPNSLFRAHRNWALMGVNARDVSPGGEWSTVPVEKTPESLATHLPTEQIKHLIAQRQQARDSKDYARADALREKLVEGGVWMNDKSRFWVAQDGRYGKVEDSADGGVQELNARADVEQEAMTRERAASVVSFHHDASRAWPAWVDSAAETVDVVIGNLPWGNKVGGREDGQHILERLCVTFSNAVLCMFVSASCFAAMCTRSAEGDMWLWRLKDRSVELPKSLSGVQGSEKIRDWSLLWQADLDFARLLVLLPDR